MWKDVWCKYDFDDDTATAAHEDYDEDQDNDNYIDHADHGDHDDDLLHVIGKVVARCEALR